MPENSEKKNDFVIKNSNGDYIQHRNINDGYTFVKYRDIATHYMCFADASSAATALQTKWGGLEDIDISEVIYSPIEVPTEGEFVIYNHTDDTILCKFSGDALTSFEERTREKARHNKLIFKSYKEALNFLVKYYTPANKFLSNYYPIRNK